MIIWVIKDDKGMFMCGEWIYSGIIDVIKYGNYFFSEEDANKYLDRKRHQNSIELKNYTPVAITIKEKV